MSYSPRTIPFREGPIIIEAYRSLKIKPDVLIIRGDGALRRSKVGLASYVGVLINKPSIGVTKELIHGALNEDNIIIDDEIKGKALKIKELANPVYISPGHGLSVDKALEIIKKVSDPEYKLPLPMHLAHKHINKLKKQLFYKLPYFNLTVNNTNYFFFGLISINYYVRFFFLYFFVFFRFRYYNIHCVIELFYIIGSF